MAVIRQIVVMQFSFFKPGCRISSTFEMSDMFSPILAKKIDLYLNPSMVDLGFKTNDLIKPLKPEDLKRVSKIIEDFISIVGETINNQYLEIKDIIKTALNDAKISVSEKLSKNIVAICEERINVEKYLSKFPKFIVAIERHYSGMGLKFDSSRYRLDLSSAKYVAMVQTLVRRNNEKIKTELNILLHATDTSKNNIDNKSKDDKMTSNALPITNIWKEIETDFDISKRAFGKKLTL